MANPPAYNNDNIWIKYKNSYLSVQKNHQNQKIGNDTTHEELWKDLLNKMHIYSAFPLKALQAAQS